MALYSYVKRKHFPTRTIITVCSIIFIFSGISLLAWTLLPIVSFELFYAPRFGRLIAPIPNEIIKQTLGQEIAQVLGTSADFTRASVWFPRAAKIKTLNNTESSYTLSIPKLGIDNAQVLVGTEDLSKSLIQFIGPLPGNMGNPVIFGHSTIPWLYNPKDYKTIFSKLPDLKIGDIIFVSVDNITYRYSVVEMRVISPDNLSALEQNYDAPFITLITCVPPGTYLKRLAVKGRLITN